MGKRYVDLSLTIVSSGKFSMVPRNEIWGQEEVATSIGSISKPDEWPMHKFEMSTESFTHVHVPANLYQDGWTNEKVPTEMFFGEAVVFNMSHKCELEPVTAADLEATGLEVRPGDMAIVRTDWSDKHWGTAKFWVEMPYLAEDGCDWLLAKGIKAYVSDTYNDSPLAKYGEGGRLEPSRLGSPTHYKFLKANVILVEYVTNLSALKKSRVELVCLPLKLSGVGQAPARVVAIENDGPGRGVSRRRRTTLG
jgi:kynurenine formamidase